jgi:signal transduction histidine kinase
LSLRRKLLLGFGGLLLVIAVAGYQGIARITRLGESIDVILRENYRSVQACQEMKEALERIDRGAMSSLLGDGGRGAAQVESNRVRFGKALDVELHNITIPGEGERAERLRTLFVRYGEAVDRSVDVRLSPQARRDAYFGEALPLFGEVKDSADAILRMNQEQMFAMDRRARARAAAARRGMFAYLAAATLLAGLFLYGTGRWVLRPIHRLNESTREIRKGNLDLVISSDSRDEIGQLSASFNEMAASLREFRRSSQSRYLRAQRAVSQAFDSLPDAIAVLDPDGRVEVASTAARDIFGLRPESYLKDLPHGWMVPPVDGAMQTGRPAQGSGPAVQHFVGNEERFWHPRAIPILDADKMPAGVVLLVADVTRQREQDELKRGVISTVSHQLKTPLTSIRMAVHLLLGESVGTLNEKQVELAMAARDDADRLDRIVEDLLDLSRIESGRSPMEFRAVPPSLLVASASEPFRAAARDRGVALVLSAPGTLPEAWVDPARISHVFDNLLTNALRHTPAGGRVTVSAEAEADHVRFRVSDTGTGIPREYLPRLFEPFFRVPGQAEETGIGLGLSIVREIVEAHGGAVRAESREGEGSVFLFTVRRADRLPEEGLRTP